MKVKFVGTKTFGPEIDITDPCYDKDVWCRMNKVKIKEGEYHCAIWPAYDGYTDPRTGKEHRYSMVARIGIYLGDVPARTDLVKIGFIGVDTGLAGFFNDKPDYDDNAWKDVHNSISGKDYLISEDGFFSRSGYGDGEYPVFAEKDENGEIVSLEIAFM